MTNNDSIVTMYLKEINRIPLLSHEEETALALKAARGDKKAKDMIVRANLRFVVNVAKKYQRKGLELPDLISEGNIGLMIAIERFDASKGYHFISYAVWWIRQAILKAICEKSRAIRLPLNKANELVKIERVRRSLANAKSEEDEVKAIGAMLGMEAQHVREMINLSHEMLSLDASIPGDLSARETIGDTIEDSEAKGPVEQAMAASMKADLQDVLDTLRPNEAQVLRLRYGLNGEKPRSLKEVGDICNLTKERIRQIEKRAIVRMRQPARLSKLEAYVA